MIKFFLARVLSWIAKISWSDFLRIVWAAQSAASQWPKSVAIDDTEREAVNDAVNAKRAAAVTDFIEQAFPVSGWMTNVLRELAVAWLNRSKS